MSERYKYSDNGLYIDHYVYEAPQSDSFYRHMHNEYELLYILGGDITYVIEDRKYKLKKHDLIVIRPQAYHFIQIDSSVDYERYDLLFSPEWLGIDNIDRLPKELEVVNCRHRGVIRDLFKKFDYYVSVMKGGDLTDVLTLLIKELIYNLNVTPEETGQTHPEDGHPLVAKALSRINESLFTVESIADIARELYVTESYLYRIFKQELKTTPLKYITEKRLFAAQALIRQGAQPSKIYQECGFGDYTSFYRNYVKLFGVSPSQVNQLPTTPTTEKSG